MNRLTTIKTPFLNKIKTLNINAWTFRIKTFSSVVPTTSVEGLPLTNFNSVTVVNNAVRGFVFSFRDNSLSVNQPSPINSTKTFWLSSAKMSVSGNNVFSTATMPIWFNNTFILRTTVNFGSAGPTNVISTIAQSGWKFYAITTTDTTTSLYVDGVLVRTVNVNWGGDTNKIFFGSLNDSAGSFYLGFIDDMRLYSMTLTPTEIQSLYITTKI